MHKCGVLLLTAPLQCSRAALPTILERLSRSVRDVYVHVQPGLQLQSVSSTTPGVTVPFTQSVCRYLAEFYKQAAIYPTLNTRLVISNIGLPSTTQHSIKSSLDVIVLDQKVPEAYFNNVKEFVKGVVDSKSDLANVDVIGMELKDVEAGEAADQLLDTYKHVCVGGTFDRLHTGHKILLSETLALAQNEVTIGVTEPNMNKRKTLNELIEPAEKRIEILKEFVHEIKPGLKYNITAISDMYGPSITVEDLGCLIVSEETRKGGAMVNEKRKEKGMKEAVIHCIELVEDTHHSEYEETKISSSSMRKRLLGTLLKPAKQVENRSRKPYVIGLTGGIASGKTSTAERLQRQGAMVIDCDKLGHIAYLKGSEAFQKIVEAFGEEVVGEDGEINRKVLGPKVFAAKSEMEKLNQIVWPAIAELCHKQIDENKDTEVVILDAAVLLEAGWDSFVHEVWTTLVPREEAIKRIMERNGLSEEAASQRIDSQMPNREKVDRANVILSTLWAPEYSQQQVEKAWKLLQERLKEKP